VWGLELAMKVVGLEESGEALHSTGQHMSPPALARAKMGSIVVDMGNHGEVDYSPNKKSSMRPEPVSRIHLIPLLMVLVFFILWAGSTGAQFFRLERFPIPQSVGLAQSVFMFFVFWSFWGVDTTSFCWGV
jgi:hypothetical protein